MKFKFIPKYLGWVQFVVSIEEQFDREKYMTLFEINRDGFHNVYGVIPSKYGIDIDPNNTDMIIDGVDVL
jgi:hypothetical protein